MPLEIKDKRTKKVKACAVAGNSLKCGHCDMDIKHGHRWLALDDPYFCLIHETCLTMFDFDGKDRLDHTPGREEARERMDSIVKTINDMTSKPWFRTTKLISDDRKRALQQLLMVYQSLRTATVINDNHIDRALESLAGFQHENWFKAIPQEQQKAIRAIIAVHHANKCAEKEKKEDTGTQIEHVEQTEKITPKPFYFKSSEVKETN